MLKAYTPIILTLIIKPTQRLKWPDAASTMTLTIPSIGQAFTDCSTINFETYAIMAQT